MDRLLIIYVIFFLVYSLIKKSKRPPEKKESDSKEIETPSPSPPPHREKREEEEEEPDIFSLPLELEEDRDSWKPSPSKKKKERKTSPSSPFIPSSPKKRSSSFTRIRKDPSPEIKVEEKGKAFQIHSLKQGIILSEILGPPRSRRPYTPPYKRR